MRFICEDYPNLKDPGDWLAVLPVQISDPLRHSPPCRKFEAVIDSGASICMFHSSIGESIGLNIEKGEKDQTIGVSGAPTVMYRHIGEHFRSGPLIGDEWGWGDKPICFEICRIDSLLAYRIKGG